MAQTVYNVFKKGLVDGAIDLDTGGDDIRVLLLEAATDVNPDDTTVQAVLARAGTTELTSTGYTRSDGTLTSEATSQDDANDRAEFDAGDCTFSSVTQASSETVDSYLIFKFVTNDADSIPIMHDDTATGLPLTPNGSNIKITWNAEGILQVT